MASSIRQTAIVLLLFLFLNEHCNGIPRWNRRWRRRTIPPCRSTNCQVGLWSPWSSCTDKCGNQGTQHRTRIRVIIERCKGGCLYHLNETRTCNRNACQNGGSPTTGYCVCPAGFTGTCCERVINATVSPTVIPKSATKCFKCLAPYPVKCKPTIQTCKSDSVCYIGQYTIKHTGQRIYASGCTKLSDCRMACDRATQTGKVSHCSVKCCNQDLCNYRVLPTATASPTTNNRPLLRVLFNLLAGLKHMVDAISTLVKIHFNKDLATLHKRGIMDMLTKVELTAQQLDKSRDPEVVKAKQDVARTRMRVMETLKQLDDYTDTDEAE